MNAIIYDCEIVKAIPSPQSYCEKGIKYCSGWSDHARMGISVIGVYDYVEDRYRVFCDDNSDEFTALWDNREICVGFNNIPFDNTLIRATKNANWQAPDDVRCYDILRETWAGAGLGAEFNRKTHGGYGLDAMCEKNFGTKKSGNGALAPVLWQKGKIGQVIDYCLTDIRLTKQLFDKIIETGELICPKTGGKLTIRKPDHG